MDYLLLFNSAVKLSAPIILIAMGGLFALKVDVFNLGLDAFALVGCFASVVGAYLTESVWGGVLFGVLITVIMTLVYAVFVFELGVNAVVCAVAMITLTEGLTRYLMIPIFGTSGKYILPGSLALKKIHFGFLDSVPILGPILNNQSLLVYVALLSPFLIWVFLYKTNLGLSVRAIGQSAEAAGAAGINVKRIRYFALIMNGIFCGLAGAQLALILNMFNVGMTGGRGFSALAVLILTNSSPILSLLAGLLFGFADALSNLLSTEGYPSQILGMLPYGLALIAAVLPMIAKTIMKKRKKKLSERGVMQLNRNQISAD
ncbi:MAG: transporter permease [Bacillota bacterium]|jgi:simple sugar transport system permease protein|nr:transporter permease [Bacillota bacterium]